MPFTVSHVVAVIPLYKILGKYTALSALIIGSMTPDFAYLTPFLVDQRMDSHSLIGIYLFGIPMGLTVYFIYHYLMAPVIVSTLPKSLQQFLHKDLFEGKIPNISSFTLIFSLLLGSLAHIFWDFFTHRSGLPQFISWMDTPLTSIDNYDIMPYRLLQHFSSLLGLSLLLFLIWKWYARKKLSITIIEASSEGHWQAPDKFKRIARYTLLIIPAVIGIMNGFTNLPETDVLYGLYGAQIFIRYAILGSAAAFILSCAVLGLFYQASIYRNTKRF